MSYSQMINTVIRYYKATIKVRKQKHQTQLKLQKIGGT